MMVNSSVRFDGSVTFITRTSESYKFQEIFRVDRNMPLSSKSHIVGNSALEKLGPVYNRTRHFTLDGVVFKCASSNVSS